MKINPHKKYSITKSGSRTLHPPLTLCGLVLVVSNSLKLLDITIDDKLTFKNHDYNIASYIAQKNVTRLLAIMI